MTLRPSDLVERRQLRAPPQYHPGCGGRIIPAKVISTRKGPRLSPAYCLQCKRMFS